MTTLLVDMGNSRLKWALRRGSSLGRMRAIDVADDVPGVLASWAAGLPRVNAPCRHLADLVLRGLVVLAAAQNLTDVTTP